jgi:hypothetical protein
LKKFSLPTPSVPFHTRVSNFCKNFEKLIPKFLHKSKNYKMGSKKETRRVKREKFNFESKIGLLK